MRNGIRAAISGIFPFFVVTVVMLGFGASPASAATSAGGSCPTGNTIDANGNPVSLASLGITSCFYISKASGVDSNSGTSESSPWAHLPGMPSCTNTCASTNPGAGQGFILRGGDTWTSGDLGVDWMWSGTSSNPIYVGVDKTWFNSSCGSSWCRPIFNAQSAVGSNQMQLDNNTANTIFDNIEHIGMRNNQNGYYLGNSGSNNRITQNYFHAWSHTGNSNNVGFFALCQSGTMIDHNVMDGSDSSQNTMNGIYAQCAGTIQDNYFNYMVSGVLGSVDNFNGNLIENAVTSADGDHCNLMFIFGHASSNNLYVYNNIVRKMICQGGVNFWLNGNSANSSWVTYSWNNIIDASSASGNVFNIGGHPSQGNSGTYYVYNTTVIANNGGTCMGNGEASPRSTTNYANLHCVGGAKLCDGTGTTCNSQGGSLLEAASSATTQGYTASELMEYSPISTCTPSTCPTVQAGTDMSQMCSGTASNLCNSISYPMYNSTNHTMGTDTATPAGNTRGSSWDIGAYEFAAGGAGAPAPPTGLAAVVQ